MSGVEILGVVASIVQIAELGGRLSVKLCTFCHKFKNANKALRHLSKDVALTCNVLRQLGESLGQDDLACLYSPDAFETAQDVLRECEQVFQDLESAIEQHYPDPVSQSRIDKVARKFKFLLNESHLDTVAGNLERLKSTMLLMLNVVIYAGQIRSRREAYELQEQRNLLLILTSEKIESERNYERLTRTLQFTSITEKSPKTENFNGSDQPDEIKDELYHYCQMVKSVLHDINTVQQLLDRDRYFRIRSGFINVHRAEASALQRVHGQRAISLFHTHLNDSSKLKYGVLFHKDARIRNIIPVYRVLRSNPLAVQLDTSSQAHNSLNSVQESVQVLPNLQSSTNFNGPNIMKPPPSQVNASELSAQQIRERAMLISREFHHPQPVEQSADQTDPLHCQQRGAPPLEVRQARAMQLQHQQFQRLMQNVLNRPVTQSPPMPQMPRYGQQMQQQQMQQQQMQNRPMMQAQSVPQMQLNPPQSQPNQLMTRNSGVSSKKRKAITFSSAEDSLEPQSNSESMPEAGQPKRIHLDSSTSTDESSSTASLPATNARTETQDQGSAAMEDQPSTSEDTSTEGPNTWILRWTTLEQTELK
ncbi:hypothetical protein PEBR_00188 [Penicillium brasilianum]|uniref:Fungal N-terminal domain-containing protein n=1 Tax=Penicillium brasilianum TaxID=104259 RepID=A0A1S9S0M7_PENBI|nr:hypothetical protein PEBR_00188 [Penicillium brasilianum]